MGFETDAKAQMGSLVPHFSSELQNHYGLFFSFIGVFILH